MNSMVCTFNWSALCRSANINISAALSMDRLLHSASSHMTFSLSRAYCKTNTVQNLVNNPPNVKTIIFVLRTLSAAASKSSAILSKFAARPV